MICPKCKAERGDENASHIVAKGCCRYCLPFMNSIEKYNKILKGMRERTYDDSS